MDENVTQPITLCANLKKLNLKKETMAYMKAVDTKTSRLKYQKPIAFLPLFEVCHALPKCN